MLPRAGRVDERLMSADNRDAAADLIVLPSNLPQVAQVSATEPIGWESNPDPTDHACLSDQGQTATSETGDVASRSSGRLR
jgi:hypothetical protein